MNEIFPTINSINQRQANRASVSKETTMSEAGSFKEKLDRVTISKASRATVNSEPKRKRSSEIRHDLVKKFQKELKKGFYEIKADAIAEKMVQKIRDDKDLKFV
jgi:flagellar biosynthesis anti-sigma factor FlgM